MKTNSTKKTSVLLILICLIPLVGGIAGIVLIILGRHQNNKGLFKLGIFGLFITILTYTVVYIISQLGYDDTKQTVRLTQKVLYMLKQDIEAYKKEHGAYPKSLETLAHDNQTTLIDDPILLSKRDKTIRTTFNYFVEGNGYKLFSVGIDGKANTKDDIYP